MRVGDDQVVVERAGEEHGFLRHDAEVMAQFVGGQIADVVTVDFDGAVFGLIETLQQFGQRALAGARRPHDSDGLAGLDLEIEALIQLRQVLGIAEAEIPDFDLPLALAQRVGRWSKVRLGHSSRHPGVAPQCWPAGIPATSRPAAASVGTGGWRTSGRRRACRS